MGCTERQTRIDAYLDGELDVVLSQEMEAHLETCAACSRALASHRALREAVSNEALYERAPEALYRRVRESVRAGTAKPAPAVPRWPFGRWLVLSAALAAPVFVALLLIPRGDKPTRDDVLAQEVLTSHVRSLMASHLMDVPSTDQHTVKPWFDGKLDFAPPVGDFSDQGFPLVGGRLDYIDNRAVAALVYQRRKHFINLFVWPAPPSSDSSAPAATSSRGYNLLHWVQDGMTFWVSSDVSAPDLMEFSGLVWNSPRSPTNPAIR